jgi:hypothetical protein
MNDEPRIPEKYAVRIWDLLVERLDAQAGEQDAFVWTQSRGCTEYRFGGKLGFGGKFWHNGGRWYVDAYREDKILFDPSLLATIDLVNQELQILREEANKEG